MNFKIFNVVLLVSVLAFTSCEKSTNNLISEENISSELQFRKQIEPDPPGLCWDGGEDCEEPSSNCVIIDDKNRLNNSQQQLEFTAKVNNAEIKEYYLSGSGEKVLKLSKENFDDLLNNKKSFDVIYNEKKNLTLYVLK